MNTNTTLVLGAGSSVAFGYPTGGELRTQLLDLPSKPNFCAQAGLWPGGRAELDSFLDAFRQSQRYSIDAFLATRPRFTEIGKKAIAALLLQAEADARLDRPESQDNWHQYLWNSLVRSNLEELSFERLRVVTFNYDRSLEQYLEMAICASYGCVREVARNKLATLEVVHVYGCIGAMDPLAIGYLPDKSPVHANQVALAASQIQVIPEGRDDADSLQAAREHLQWAEQIGFLGFGFDATNLARLASNETCCPTVKRNDGWHIRNVVGTAMGLTAKEIGQAELAMKGPNGTSRPVLRDCNCLDLLRNEPLLD